MQSNLSHINFEAFLKGALQAHASSRIQKKHAHDKRDPCGNGWDIRELERQTKEDMHHVFQSGKAPTVFSIEPELGLDNLAFFGI